MKMIMLEVTRLDKESILSGICPDCGRTLNESGPEYKDDHVIHMVLFCPDCQVQYIVKYSVDSIERQSH